MAKYAIVKNDDLSILSVYDDASHPNHQADFGGPWGRAEHCTHVAVDALDSDAVEAINVAEKWTKDGEADESSDPADLSYTHVPAHVALQEDSAKAAAKLQSGREAKLQAIRDQREDKLKDMDNMATDVALATRADAAAVATYKADLLAITDSYKDVNGDADTAIDALASDVSDIVWPTAP